MTQQSTRRGLRVVVLTVLVAAGAVIVPMSGAAVADDAAAAWSLAPADASGVADGRTRFELQTDPGASVQDHLVISNVSTIERTFSVYGADAFNTVDGGYDLKVAAAAQTDVGAWVTVDTPTVTVPALSDAVVALTVTVPVGEAPGDHPGGIVVSVAAPAAANQSVVVDTRVAVRLNVRVSGELTPALDVRSVAGTYSSSWVPFGAGPAEVTYVVTNTGNVKIVGKPRVRVTGPFGVRLARVSAGATRELLPGQSFTVRTDLASMWPGGVATAVVDVDMAAAPGPETEIPLVSGTARSTFVAVSWSGLVLVALIASAVWLVVRAARRRRREGEELWQAMLVEARDDGAAVRGPHGGAGLVAVAVLVVALGAMVGSVLAAPSAVAGAVRVAGDASDPSGALELDVPPPPSSAAGTSAHGRRSAVSTPAADVPVTDGAAAPAAAPSAAPTATPSVPDLVWAAWTAHRRTPAQWSIVGAGCSGLAVVAGLFVRTLLPTSRRRESSMSLPDPAPEGA